MRKLLLLLPLLLVTVSCTVTEPPPTPVSPLAPQIHVPAQSPVLDLSPISDSNRALAESARQLADQAHQAERTNYQLGQKLERYITEGGATSEKLVEIQVHVRDIEANLIEVQKINTEQAAIIKADAERIFELVTTVAANETEKSSLRQVLKEAQDTLQNQHDAMTAIVQERDKAMADLAVSQTLLEEEKGKVSFWRLISFGIAGLIATYIAILLVRAYLKTRII